MRKLIVAMLIVASNQVSAFAPTNERKIDKEVYENIQELLDKEIIDCKTAQKMWRAYKTK